MTPNQDESNESFSSLNPFCQTINIQDTLKTFEAQLNQFQESPEIVKNHV